LGAIIAPPAVAHPSRAIAVDRNDRVVFSDLVRIWRIDGAKLTLIRDNRGNHTHGMIVDASGQLVWEESNYQPATMTYRETIWELRDSRPIRRFGPLSNPSPGLGIARDAAGCTYRADQSGRAGPVFVHRLCPGRASALLVGNAGAAARFRPVLVNDVSGVAIALDGRFVFRHGGAVHAVDRRGRISLLADRIANENFGIALQPSGALLVVEHDRRRVLRIAGAHSEQVSISPAGWAPTGVAAGRNGQIYVLESTIHQAGRPLRMQVRQIAPGRARLLARVTVPNG